MGNFESSRRSTLQIANYSGCAFRTRVDSKIVETDIAHKDHQLSKSLNDVVILPDQIIIESEDIKSNTGYSSFRLTFTAESNDEESSINDFEIRVDQMDAFKTLNRVFYQSDNIVVLQKCDGETNFFVICLASWMSRIPSSTPITAISIPGTHDSGTSNGPHKSISASAARDYILTQEWGILDQLRAGIRFLDIRCHNDSGSFGIVHGPFDIQNITFRDVLDDCIKFLAQFPLETILLSLKDQRGSRGSRISFADAFREQYVAGAPWYMGTDLPHLGDARGKIVLISRFGAFEFGFPIIVRNNAYTSEQSNAVDYHIQDVYRVDAACDIKVAQVNEFLQRARNGDRNDLYLNFSSGTNPPWNTVAQIAAKVNSRIVDSIQAGRYGTLIMDYPPVDLIARIVQSNMNGLAAGRELLARAYADNDDGSGEH
jgi:1-phosphatidylinositol phosphodiesterase